MLGAAIFIKKQNVSFDIVHHVTFVNDWLPSFFSLLKNKDNKFVWGPIGSNDPIDQIFLTGVRQSTTERIKIMLRFLFRILDPWFFYCKFKADCIIGINENVRKKLFLSDEKYFITEYILFCTLFFLLGFLDDLKIDIKPKFRLFMMIIFLIFLYYAIHLV